jgi:hypothetical protein
MFDVLKGELEERLNFLERIIWAPYGKENHQAVRAERDFLIRLLAKIERMELEEINRRKEFING